MKTLGLQRKGVIRPLGLVISLFAPTHACEGSAQAAVPEDDSRDITSEVEHLSLEELMDVRITPFEASTRRDRGYRAFSSVTASRLDTPIGELPFAVQVFTQPFIQDVKPITIYDVAKYSPSVTYRSNDFNEGNANLAIRGFAVGSTPGAVQVLRDGFHGPSIFEFTNVARVEIVKGPASFLYGQVAPGGIVNIITKAPRSEFESSATVRYGSYDAYRFEGDVTGPLEEGLYFRVTSSADQDIRYWRPYLARSFDISPTLLWAPSRSATITLKHEYYRKRETPQVMQKPGYGRQRGIVPTPADPNLEGVAVPGLPSDWNSMSHSDFRDSATLGFSAVLDVKAHERWDVRASYAYQDYEIDAAFSGNFGMATEHRFMQGRRMRRQVYTNWDDTFELNATGRYDLGFASLRLLLGGQVVVRRFDVAAAQAPNDPAFGPIASPRPNWDLRDSNTWDRAAPPYSTATEGAGGYSMRSLDRAAFAGATLGFFDSRLLVLAGVRLTKSESQSVTVVMPAVAKPRFDTQELTPQYGLLYKLFPGASVFATYAESFVPTGEMLTERNVDTVRAEPTHGRGVDVGAKVDVLEGRLSGTLTAFDVRNTNIINDISELDPDTGLQIFSRVQSGEQRCSGVEMDATLTLIDGWQTYLSYSYNHARIVEFSGRDATVLATGASAPGYKEVLLFHDAPLQMSAPHLANVWSRYDISGGSLDGLHVAAGMNLVFDQQLLPATPAKYRQTYALLNGQLGYAWDVQAGFALLAELYGKNLTNREYRPSQSSRSRPRELGVAFTVKY
ncbi:MAG TPA: TonB-dependent receptor [Polyangiaceae bacterium]